MEESAQCNCGSWDWNIFRDRIVCSECEKEYGWPLDCTNAEATKAQDIIHLVNDNH